MVLANVPSFRSLVPGNTRMYPRSVFWYRGPSAKTTLLETTLLQGEKHININKCAGLSQDWVGGQNIFMCFFSGHSLWGRKKHIDKVPPKIPKQSREKSVYVLFALCVFFTPNFCEPPILGTAQNAPFPG